MLRAVAVLVAASMLSASGPGAPWHVHDYLDHDHADHRHGPAAHSHGAAADHPHEASSDGGEPMLDPCDPGEHAVSVVFAYVGCDGDRAPLVVVLTTARIVAPADAVLGVAPSEVRAHGPPGNPTARLRAPPLTRLA